LGDTISNCELSKLDRLPYDSRDALRIIAAPCRGGDAVAVVRGETSEGDEESVDDWEPAGAGLVDLMDDLLFLAALGEVLLGK